MTAIQTKSEALRDTTIAALIQQANIEVPDDIIHSASSQTTYVWRLTNAPIAINQWTASVGSRFALALTTCGSDTHQTLKANLIRGLITNPTIDIDVAMGTDTDFTDLATAIRDILTPAPPNQAQPSSP